MHGYNFYAAFQGQPQLDSVVEPATIVDEESIDLEEDSFADGDNLSGMSDQLGGSKLPS